jgi:ArsR family transcriptional regulator, arsenate/arsenite/antimonite-responsive transcriptional repressor
MKRSAVIAALGALAQETRLEIFRLLVHKGPEGLPAGEIGERLGQPSPTLSFHLNQLRHAGLVISRRDSRSIIYRANFKAMSALIAFLTEQCCDGRPELCGLPVLPPSLGAAGSCAAGTCGTAGGDSGAARDAAQQMAAVRTRARAKRKTAVSEQT